MILIKLVIKTLFYNFILNNHVSAIYFRKKMIYYCHGVDISDDVSTTKAIRRVNKKTF